MLFMSVEEFERGAFRHDEHGADPEIAPGARVARRQVLRLVATGLGLGLLPVGRSRAGQEPAAAGAQTVEVPPPRKPVAPALGFDAWVDQVRPLARQLVAANGPDEEAYLMALANLLARLDPIPQLSREPFFVGPKKDQAYDMALYYPPILVSHIILRPGALIELHDHRHYNGVLMGLQGRALVRNFEIDGRDDIPPAGEEFTIRQTARIALKPGDLSTLSRTRDNIHEVRADDVETHLLDVFTYFRKEARSYEIAFDDKPLDEAKGLYKAAWKGR